MDNIKENSTDKVVDLEKQELKELLELNIKKSEEILAMSREIKNYIKWDQIWSMVRFLLIVVPVVLGVIYLPPILREAFDSYKSLLK